MATKTYDFLLLDYTNETARWFLHREDAEMAEFGLMSENAATDVFRVHNDRVLLMDSNYRWHDAPADMVDKILSQWRKINRIKGNPPAFDKRRMKPMGINPRMTMPRDFYIPKEGQRGITNIKEHTRENLAGVAYTYSQGGKLYAMGFGGKRSKPDFHYRFKDEVSRRKYVNEFFAGLRSQQKRKAEKQAKKRAFQHTLKKGDILNTSWGYDQTNVEFYQVTQVKSKKSVVIKRIGAKRVEATGPDSEMIMPVKGAFLDEPAMTKRVSEGNTIRIDKVRTAWVWSGRPVYTSWGH